jgi:hypothetical protein
MARSLGKGQVVSSISTCATTPLLATPGFLFWEAERPSPIHLKDHFSPKSALSGWAHDQ